MDNSTISFSDKSDFEIDFEDNKLISDDKSTDLENRIANANDNDEILIEPGTYYLHDILITKNITLQGNGNARDIIIDGQELSSIFLIRNYTTYVTFNNITFINGLTYDFGGAISMETGNVYVDNCIFINNTALGNTNAGAISNYGNETNPAYLRVTNSLFINNYADHDGGAVTTCYASSDIINSVFINNSAHRDGGAIRVSLFGHGNVEDCIFMFNHADEWGGAYYSWSGGSNINRCIFLNNTAGTNGGAVMVSGNLNLTNSIIVNNTGSETGGSFYIQQPMYKADTEINVNNNLITNNTSPLGKEIFIKWDDTEYLYTNFNNNDWGDENPNDSSVIDPKKVTPRSKVSKTKSSNLLNVLSLDELNKYSDLLKGYFPDGYFGEETSSEPKEDSNSQNTGQQDSVKTGENSNNNIDGANSNNITASENFNVTSKESVDYNPNMPNNSTSTVGSDDSKAYELNKTQSATKTSSIDFRLFLIIIVTFIVALVIGYRKKNRDE